MKMLRRSLSYESLEYRQLLAVFSVDNVNNIGLGSLREAIGAANALAGPDTIEFNPSVFVGDTASVIRLDGTELEITEALTVDGSMGIDVTITGDASNNDVKLAESPITDVTASLAADENSLNDNSRVINFSAVTGDLELIGLTITGGHAKGNSDTGGGVLFGSDGTLTISNSMVSGNSTTGTFGDGGGVASGAGDIILIDSIVSGNQAPSASAVGGGISTNSGSVHLTTSSVRENSATGTAGTGGGIYSFSGAINLLDSIVSENNSGDDGGGIYAFTGDVNLTRSTVSGNATSGSFSSGGGIFVISGTVNATASTISGNMTTGDFSYAGGIFSTSGDLVLTSSTISGNVSGDAGGGIFLINGDISLISSTVSGNISGRYGGGVYVRGLLADAAMVLQNSIVAGNTDDGTAPDLRPDTSGLVTASHSLIGNTTSGLTFAQRQAIASGIGNLENVDPQLAPLADNGGPTQTQALLPASPALNVGLSNEAFDQRGAPYLRDDGNGVDIGAFEAQVISFGDFDADGDVDGSDFLRWQRDFVADETTAADLANWELQYGATPLAAPVDSGADALENGPIVQTITALPNVVEVATASQQWTKNRLRNSTPPDEKHAAFDAALTVQQVRDYFKSPDITDLEPDLSLATAPTQHGDDLDVSLADELLGVFVS